MNETAVVMVEEPAATSLPSISPQPTINWTSTHPQILSAIPTSLSHDASLEKPIIQTSKLLTIAPEIRLKIYKAAIGMREINLELKHPPRVQQPWVAYYAHKGDCKPGCKRMYQPGRTSSTVKSRLRHACISITSAASLLLVSRQIYVEAKSLVYDCPAIVIAGTGETTSNAEFKKLRLSKNIYSRIEELVLPSDYFDCFWKASNSIGFCFERKVFPKLQTVRFVPSYTSSELQDMFLAAPSSIQGQSKRVRQTKRLIETSGLMLKGDVKFAIQLNEKDKLMRKDESRALREECFKALVTWEQEGVAITNLPEKENSWWATYADLESAGKLGDPELAVVSAKETDVAKEAAMARKSHRIKTKSQASSVTFGIDISTTASSFADFDYQPSAAACRLLREWNISVPSNAMI
ncbi:hypothetical protein H2200_002482 [Cladophialophora chaetospira]|uniref:Uncharacterized protein n=1 Tax=Cladophialophora chaetospira TaxID=386627 RepID=A0AA39CM62_9EURO|nr:hypothetical protein H2200_002482 [Cladophialophora chaetospira]